MSHFDDLAPCPLAWKGCEALRAIGWLERGRPYAHGDVDEHFFESLVQLLVHPWQPAATAGRHSCSLCRFIGGPGGITYKDTTITLGSANVFVPGNGVIYVAPSLVVHYVDAHDYQPPSEFVEAVLRCPPMRSMEYLRQLKAIGGTALVNARKGM
ncbi:hypothetical protein WME88_53360 [Sorangium sp. So ce216]